MPVTERITTVSVSMTPSLRNLTPDSNEPVVTPVARDASIWARDWPIHDVVGERGLMASP